MPYIADKELEALIEVANQERSAYLNEFFSSLFAKAGQLISNAFESNRNVLLGKALQHRIAV